MIHDVQRNFSYQNIFNFYEETIAASPTLTERFIDTFGKLPATIKTSHLALLAHFINSLHDQVNGRWSKPVNTSTTAKQRKLIQKTAQLLLHNLDEAQQLSLQRTHQIAQAE